MEGYLSERMLIIYGGGGERLLDDIYMCVCVCVCGRYGGLCVGCGNQYIR